MTRTKAREIALGCLFECMFRNTPPEEVLDYRLSDPGFKILAGEDGLFSEELTTNDEEYIRGVVTVAMEKSEELFSGISELCIGWKSGRISYMSRAILTLSLTEILYREDVPLRSSINEAVELAKKYDTDKAPSFINGILGQYVRDMEKKEETCKEPSDKITQTDA